MDHRYHNHHHYHPFSIMRAWSLFPTRPASICHHPAILSAASRSCLANQSCCLSVAYDADPLIVCAWNFEARSDLYGQLCCLDRDRIQGGSVFEDIANAFSWCVFLKFLLMSFTGPLKIQMTQMPEMSTFSMGGYSLFMAPSTWRRQATW
jgi:hypothetical protein